MGRLTLFSVDDCVHCVRLTQALKDHEIPYTEISLATHPHRRPDMLSITDRLTVPQVFFNETHIGGADDTFKVLEKWYHMDPSKSIRAQFHELVAAQPDPTDPRLAPSTDAPAQPSKAPTRPQTDKLKLPDGSYSSVISVMEKLKKILPCSSCKSKRVIYKRSFTGEEATKVFLKDFKQITTEEEAIRFGEYLRRASILHSLVDDTTEFTASHKTIYRLQCFMTPNILNTYRVWNTVVDHDYMAILGRLKVMLDKVEKDSNSKTNSKSMTSKSMAVFEEAVCELQRVDLSQLDTPSSLKAFGINVYNLMIKYAFFRVGIGSSSRARSAFFNGVKFQIGSEVFSFQDWEHGLLRANRKAPYSMKHQFGRKDPRLAMALPNVDCRLHFALNCGAKSCPPQRTFTADGVEEELRIVSMAFCEDDSNVEIDAKRRILYLNKIMSWYRVDFCDSEKELPGKLLEYLRGEKRETLERLLQSRKPITVSYKTYDWSNDGDFAAFDSAVLRADVQRLMGSLKFKIKRKKSNVGLPVLGESTERSCTERSSGEIASSLLTPCFN
ncbi:Protein of unknown function, DUF547 [Seminavis robusta]|uniref:Glutaredoxin domain-containing protein n=1 Tax=Seminavis robusta TaxID=568900 RepID=A0A9N8E4P4_9STRA|nr:Protein of unknown function, DUF547 [Seminavis robusta]|eukprot:Sro664_g183670.1 Protein of unknown function, DUF547 (555) ;mRNA; f:32347-34011